MDTSEILAAAKALPDKLNIEEYREVVDVLREKGFTWREVAAFLVERGVSVDHTRLFRHFGNRQEERRTDSREISINKAIFVGEKKKGNRTTWNVMDIELPTKLGPIIVKGFAWSTGDQHYMRSSDDTLELRNPTLILRSKNKGFPYACITVDFKLNTGDWAQQDVHIVPKWEALL